ncbi:MAG: M20 family metallopeptidase [Christensenellales bacterium]|jgi:amidohydrolase
MEFKKSIDNTIESVKNQLFEMADSIFDNPETSFKETYASKLLSDAFKEKGFDVKLGLGSLNTAFRAEYKQGEGGPKIGLLCEYDALPMGHACAHHMQGPVMLGAAQAVMEAVGNKAPYSLIVYGTPAEEGGAGKVIMLQEGFMKDIDIALMMHGGPATQVDVKSMAMQGIKLCFHGKSAHAALKPDVGRSALDALLLTFNGIEFLREHVKEDTRMHYTVINAGGPENVVPEIAEGKICLRSYNTNYLNEVVKRVKKIAEGASIMTETTFDWDDDILMRRDGKIPSYMLNDLIMKNAEYYKAPNIKGAREKTGSTDFGAVTYIMPGTCLRMSFVDDGTSSHSQEFLNDGKTERGHNAIVFAAKILAAATAELILDPQKVQAIQEEFKQTKEKITKEA